MMMESGFKKYFTPAEAAQTLPLVKTIVADILDLGYQIHSLATMLGQEAQGHPQVQGMVDQLQEHFAELEQIGCFYKDWGFSIGLVDFPALIEGKEVFLCWRSDEPEIRYYHEIEAGYAGRKAIPEAYFME